MAAIILLGILLLWFVFVPGQESVSEAERRQRELMAENKRLRQALLGQSQPAQQETSSGSGCFFPIILALFIAMMLIAMLASAQGTL